MKRKNLMLILNLSIMFILTLCYGLFRFVYSDENYFVNKSLDEEIVDKLETIDSLKQQIKKDSTTLERLKRDDSYLERYARENFYMYREGEEVFVAE